MATDPTPQEVIEVINVLFDRIDRLINRSGELQLDLLRLVPEQDRGHYLEKLMEMQMQLMKEQMEEIRSTFQKLAQQG